MSLTRNDLMKLLEMEIKTFEEKKSQDKEFTQFTDFTNKIKPIFEAIINVLNFSQDENGVFYHHNDFIQKVKSFFYDVSNDIEDVGNIIKAKNNNLQIDHHHKYYYKSKKDLENHQNQNYKVLDYTITMARQLLKTPDNAQKAMYDYGKRIIALNLADKDLNFVNAQALIFISLDVNLHSLDLHLLDKEIKAIDDLSNFSLEKQQHHTKFVSSLKTLRMTILEDLDGMKAEEHKIDEIERSDSNQLAKDTAAMLRSLGYKEATQKDDEKKLNEFATQQQIANQPQKSARPQKFFKALGAVGAVCLAGLGFILGAAFGFVAGAIHGARYCGIGAIPGALVTSVYMGVAGGECGLRGGKWIAGIPSYESIKRHLLFKPTSKQALELTNQKALAFINRDHPDLKTKKEEKVKGPSGETLAKYFAYR